MRLGRDYGWQEVARAAGLKGIEDGNSLDRQVEQLERLTFGNALMIGRSGEINRRSQGLQFCPDIDRGTSNHANPTGP